MKIIVSIIASYGIYETFKEVMIKNIKMVKQNPEMSNIFYFYFLYTHEDETIVKKNEYYTDVIFKLPEEKLINDMLYKRFEFYQMFCIGKNFENENYFFMNTNLSTVIDYKKLSKWFFGIPRNKFFGGSYINPVILDNCISGTFTVISYDIIRILINNKRFLNTNMASDDIFISNFIFTNYLYYSKDAKRINFIEIDKKDYIYCDIKDYMLKKYIRTMNGIYEDDIFLYRLKTFDRNLDIDMMDFIIEKIWKNSHVKDIIFEKINNYPGNFNYFYDEVYNKHHVDTTFYVDNKFKCDIINKKFL